MGYLIYCPDYQIRDLNAVGLAESRVVDAKARDGLPGRIQGLLGPGAAGNESWHDKVHAFFCQTFQVVPDIHAHVSAHERAFVRQTGGRLTFDSVYRFKGQEAPAVILVDVDPNAKRPVRSERLFFCGMTRATVRLELVVQAGNSENLRFFGT